MNNIEFDCAKILIDLIENNGAIGVKTSFEDEGVSFYEAIRLKEICNQSGTKLTIKIGGPEAIRDIKDSIIIGFKGLVAPMIESDFGLKKFINSAKNNISKDIYQTIQLNINIETINAIKNIEHILNVEESSELYGVTVGRVDLVSSMNKDRNYANSEEIYELVKKVFIKTKELGLKACLGGAISKDSFTFLKKLHSEGLLDKFETRYIIFDPSITLKNFQESLYKAQKFEYQWLYYQNNYYETLAKEKNTRIKLIEERLNN